MATLFVDKLDPQSGTALEIGTSGDTITIPSGATITNSGTATGFGGITEADMFRLTADQSGGTNAVITANLERVDDATFSKIGTGMSESSGIYTFPSTGVYLVSVHARIYAINDPNATVLIDASSNSGGVYDEIAQCNAGNNNTQGTNDNVSIQNFVNVTNASTFRVRFQTETMGSSSYLLGNTGSNYTCFTFIRLGDSP